MASAGGQIKPSGLPSEVTVALSRVVNFAANTNIFVGQMAAAAADQAEQLQEATAAMEEMAANAGDRDTAGRLQQQLGQASRRVIELLVRLQEEIAMKTSA
ncbi:hypothetical protein SDD30_16765 [Moorella naiadis]|uniref:hypothetical protein n=1 Tax=Moorella naiadis (nom. illeg.) TaxID=3093670 RepID=UPI003D9C7F29